MLAVITPEKMNTSDGSMESNNDFNIPSLFQSIIQIMQLLVQSLRRYKRYLRSQNKNQTMYMGY